MGGAFRLPSPSAPTRHPIPAERLDDQGRWVPTLVKAWVKRGVTWYAWVDTPDGVRAVEQERVRKVE